MSGAVISMLSNKTRIGSLMQSYIYIKFIIPGNGFNNKYDLTKALFTNQLVLLLIFVLYNESNVYSFVLVGSIRGTWPFHSWYTCPCCDCSILKTSAEQSAAKAKQSEE